MIARKYSLVAYIFWGVSGLCVRDVASMAFE